MNFQSPTLASLCPNSASVISSGKAMPNPNSFSGIMVPVCLSCCTSCSCLPLTVISGSALRSKPTAVTSFVHALSASAGSCFVVSIRRSFPALSSCPLSTFSLAQSAALPCSNKAGSFQSQNVYFNSETSSLHWGVGMTSSLLPNRYTFAELRNIWGQ